MKSCFDCVRFPQCPHLTGRNLEDELTELTILSMRGEYCSDYYKLKID